MEGWQWKAEGHTCEGYWGSRYLAAVAAAQTLPAQKAFKVFYGLVPPRRKVWHRIVSPWVEGRPHMFDGMQYKGFHCEVEYREVDA